MPPPVTRDAGGTGTGGGPAGGASGASGAGGSSACTGDLDGATIVTTYCAYSGCHIAGSANAGVSGGLDLTIDSGIGSRLVGVMAGPASEGSLCTGKGPYLVAESSNPPTGLLIEKINVSPPCGDQMPWPGPPLPVLTSAQITCVEAWAEGLITAAAQ
jgi:hypothetical protein